MSVMVSVLGVCGCESDARHPSEEPSDPPLAVGNDLEVIRDALTAGDAIDTLVTIDPAPTTSNPTALVEPEELEDAFEDVLNSLPSGEFERFRVYKHFPTLALRLSSLDALDAVLAHPRTVSVFVDEANEMALTQSLAQIGQPTVFGNGFGGADVTVAVFDTGTDYTRAAFGSCSAAGTPGCKVVAAVDIAPSDGVVDTGSFHGTNVSGIVLGVAPQAKIAALDTFRSDGLSYSSDLAGAVDWVLDNQDTYNIVAMNLSLGSGSYTARCSNGLEPALATAKSRGILAAIATGNSGYKTSISQPACAPSAVAVGAVYDANLGGMGWSSCTDSTTAVDKATCFSNSAAFMDLLAPGALITAAGITMGGTSQATPHVAGAIAVLRAAYPDETADRTLERLKLGGVNVTDSRNGVTKPRISLPGALDAPTAPTGTLSIGGDGNYTRAAAVTLNLSSGGGATQMCISNVATCTAWIALASTKTWTLAAGNGEKTVFAKFRNAAGNVSAQVTDTITLDAAAPVVGTLNATPGNASVSLTWTGQSDAHSGIASYKLVYATGETAPANCTVGTTGYTGNATGVSATGLINGVQYSFRLCTLDNAGNISTGAVATVRPAPEFNAPTGSVSVNAGANYTGERTVTLTISGSDASTISRMCVSNTTTCTAYVNFATSFPWTLADGTGEKVVRVWLRDQYNNTSAPFSDAINLDRTAPTNPVLSGTAGNASVSMGWTAATDAHSGLATSAGYKLVYATGTVAPANCNVGTTGYNGANRVATISSLINASVYSFRLCAVDAVGNMSAGTTVIGLRPAPEHDAPTGSVMINSDASFTGARAVTLSISASDDNDVTQMCISNTATCTAFEPFNATRAWTLTDVTGSKSVRVWLRDEYGNTSAPVLDTITLDRTAPTLGVLNAVGGARSVSLSWSGQSDAHSGIANYKIVYATGSVAPACTAVALSYTINGTSATLSGLPNNTQYSLRVCAIDNVGNMSPGVARTVRTNL